MSLRGVKKQYSGAPNPAIEDITLDIEQGEIYGLVGENGAVISKMLCFYHTVCAKCIRIIAADHYLNIGEFLDCSFHSSRSFFYRVCRNALNNIGIGSKLLENFIQKEMDITHAVAPGYDSLNVRIVQNQNIYSLLTESLTDILSTGVSQCFSKVILRYGYECL